MRAVLVLAFLAVSATAFGQATPAKSLTWDQPNATLVEAQAFTYKYYPDGATTGIVLTTYTCSAVSGVNVCTAPFPSFTPGPHTLQLTATNEAGEGPKSAVFSFTFIVVPSAPVSVRIQ